MINGGIAGIAYIIAENAREINKAIKKQQQKLGKIDPYYYRKKGSKKIGKDNSNS